MKVACFCGATFQVTGGRGRCPMCGEPVFLPILTPREVAEMKADLQEILDEHTPTESQ